MEGEDETRETETSLRSREFCYFHHPLVNNRENSSQAREQRLYDMSLVSATVMVFLCYDSEPVCRSTNSI